MTCVRPTNRPRPKLYQAAPGSQTWSTHINALSEKTRDDAITQNANSAALRMLRPKSWRPSFRPMEMSSPRHPRLLFYVLWTCKRFLKSSPRWGQRCACHAGAFVSWLVTVGGHRFSLFLSQPGHAATSSKRGQERVRPLRHPNSCRGCNPSWDLKK